MRTKRTLRCMVIAVLLFCLIAPIWAQASYEAARAPQTIVFTDSTGREVELPANITRVAPSGPAAQMILYSVAPDSLIGWGTKPSDAQKKYMDGKYWNLPVFGQFYGKNNTLNLEALIAADPQVIIDLGDMKKTHKEDMQGIQEQTGIPTIFIEANLKTFPDAYRQLGKLLGVEEQAEAIATYIEQTTAMAKTNAATIPENEKVSVMFGTGSTGLDVNAKNSIHADVIDIIGAVNAIEVPNVSSKGGGNTINMEQLMMFNPDVILFSEGGPYNTVATDPLWQGLDAITDGTYYEIPGKPYNWLSSPPSVNRIIGIPWLGNLIYPELYQLDMVEEAKKFYSLFWHCNLSDDEAKDLLQNSTMKAASKR